MRRQALTAALVLFCGAAAVMAQETPAPARPSRPAPAAGPYSWAVGPFAYDPSGNVATVGGNYYVYDPMGRLVTASIERPGEGSQVSTYGYDVYGNRTTVNFAATSAASPATNRLTSGGAIYDAAGNLVQWQPPNSALIRQYTYDSLDMITSEATGGQAVANIYTADDERLWRYEVTRNVSHWTVRDLGGRVLREFVDNPTDDNGAAWKLFREYVYRDGQLLAVNTPADTEHYSLDHLGSPRLVTDGSRNKRFEHHYLPFGGEWTTSNDPADGSKLRFTSHERDTDLADQPAGSLDYMHARYYSSSMGRFFSVDTLPARPRVPQSWNRYSYVEGNPVAFVDPDGLGKMKVIELLNKGWKVLRKLESREAVKVAQREGEDILMANRKQAEELAREIGNGRPPIHEVGKGKNQFPHYHPAGRGGGHIFYGANFAAGLTFAHHARGRDGFWAGAAEVGDFLNPLSTVQDFIELHQSFYQDENGDYHYVMSGELLVNATHPETGTKVVSPGDFFYSLVRQMFHNSDFVSVHELWLDGAICIEGICNAPR